MDTNPIFITNEFINETEMYDFNMALLNNNDSLVSQCSILRDGFGFLTYFVRRCY
jgi:hypothetical protein